MLEWLFGRLTRKPSRGHDMFGQVSTLARQPHWFTAGALDDTIDGRFAILSTIAALVLARCEEEGVEGHSTSVALTERFAEVMDSEHRELGLGDPALGKTVRKLVGALARRTELWRSTVENHGDWRAATQASLYSRDIEADSLTHSAEALDQLWQRLRQCSIAQIEEGRF